MSEVLQRVKRAARAKRRTETEYRAALRAARVAGLSYGTIGAAAGISRQAARQLLERVLAPKGERMNFYGLPIVSPEYFNGEHVANPGPAGLPPVCACGWTPHGVYSMADHLRDMSVLAPEPKEER